MMNNASTDRTFPSLILLSALGLLCSPYSLAIDFNNPENCRKVDLEEKGGSMEHLPVRDQGLNPNCFSIPAADLFDAWRFSYGDTRFDHLTSSTMITIEYHQDQIRMIEEKLKQIEHMKSNNALVAAKNRRDEILGQAALKVNQYKALMEVYRTAVQNKNVQEANALAPQIKAVLADVESLDEELATIERQFDPKKLDLLKQSDHHLEDLKKSAFEGGGDTLDALQVLKRNGSCNESLTKETLLNKDSILENCYLTTTVSKMRASNELMRHKQDVSLARIDALSAREGGDDQDAERLEKNLKALQKQTFGKRLNLFKTRMKETLNVKSSLLSLGFAPSLVPSLSSIYEVLLLEDRTLFSRHILKEVANSCKPEIRIFSNIPEPVQNPIDSAANLANVIHRAFDRADGKPKQPIAVSLCPDFLRKGSSYKGKNDYGNCVSDSTQKDPTQPNHSSGHAETIVAREFRNGKCYVKLKNSWGKSCDIPDVYAEEYRKNCEGGKIWVDLETLANNTKSTTWLGKK